MAFKSFFLPRSPTGASLHLSPSGQSTASAQQAEEDENSRESAPQMLDLGEGVEGGVWSFISNRALPLYILNYSPKFNLVR